MVAIDPAPFDLSLATVTCELPPCLERTEPPWLTYTECTSQTERVFPWTAGSGWTTEPRTAAVPKTREAGKEKARIIAGHRTFLPNGEGFEEYISGGMGTEEAAKYIEKHWKGIQSDLISEKYGSGSYAQAYVAGEVSEEDFLVSCMMLIKPEHRLKSCSFYRTTGSSILACVTSSPRTKHLSKPLCAKRTSKYWRTVSAVSANYTWTHMTRAMGLLWKHSTRSLLESNIACGYAVGTTGTPRNRQQICPLCPTPPS